MLEALCCMCSGWERAVCLDLGIAICIFLSETAPVTCSYRAAASRDLLQDSVYRTLMPRIEPKSAAPPRALNGTHATFETDNLHDCQDVRATHINRFVEFKDYSAEIFIAEANRIVKPHNMWSMWDKLLVQESWMCVWPSWAALI